MYWLIQEENINNPDNKKNAGVILFRELGKIFVAAHNEQWAIERESGWCHGSHHSLQGLEMFTRSRVR